MPIFLHSPTVPQGLESADYCRECKPILGKKDGRFKVPAGSSEGFSVHEKRRFSRATKCQGAGGIEPSLHIRRIREAGNGETGLQ